MMVPKNPVMFVIEDGETVHRVPFAALAEIVRDLNADGWSFARIAALASDVFKAPFTEAHIHNLSWVCKRIEVAA